MTWTAADVPPGPYFHGSRFELQPGVALRTDEVDNNPGIEDDRQRCWATTSWDSALQWALQRKYWMSDTLYIYEVELDDPEVDVNIHRVRINGEAIDSVMAPSGRVIRLVHQQPASDHSDHRHFRR
jgi:hypothetical protein